MAEYLPSSSPDPYIDLRIVAPMIVTKVERYGKIEMLPAYNVFMDMVTEPCVARIPIPNGRAYYIAKSMLAYRICQWVATNGSTLEYHLFFDRYGRNVTHLLYMEIARTLTLFPPTGLPQVSKWGYCRISPLCHVDQVYVQMMPAYVDAISYVIYMSVSDKKKYGLIQPAEDIILGELYILSKDTEHYRVKILDTCPTLKSGKHRWLNKREYSSCEMKFDNSVATHSSDMSSGESSTTSGGATGYTNFARFSEGSLEAMFNSKHPTKEPAEQINIGSVQRNRRRHPFDGSDNEVMVKLIDFGGMPRKVSRRNIFCVKSVSPELRHLPPLAIKVKTRYVFGSTDDKEYKIDRLRSRQRHIRIETVAGGNRYNPPTIDILHNRSRN